MDSFIDIVNRVDTFPYDTIGEYYCLLTHDGAAQLGYIHPDTASYFDADSSFVVDHANRTVGLAPQLNTLDKRNDALAQTANYFRQLDEFRESVHKGWRNELYTVHYPSTELYVRVERAFSVLLGVVTYGIHLTGYVPPEKSSNGKLKLWVPRRAATKPTYPGMLDNTVAGGLGYPYGPYDTMIKECYEEAGLGEEFVAGRVRATGVILYLYQPEGDLGPVQPEVEYLYDLPFDDETLVVPQPTDGEAEDFTLLEVDEVLRLLNQQKFKPNCGLVIIDFLARHGYITPDSERNYLEIILRIHRRVPFPTRWPLDMDIV